MYTVHFVPALEQAMESWMRYFPPSDLHQQLWGSFVSLEQQPDGSTESLSQSKPPFYNQLECWKPITIISHIDLLFIAIKWANFDKKQPWSGLIGWLIHWLVRWLKALTWSSATWLCGIQTRWKFEELKAHCFFVDLIFFFCREGEEANQPAAAANLFFLRTMEPIRVSIGSFLTWIFPNKTPKRSSA